MKVIPPRVRKQIDQWRERIADELSQDSTGGVSIGNDVEVYFDGDRAFRAMIGAIAEAQEQVHLEMYMFLSDQTGRLFADALIKKAKEGIQVRVIYDAIGSADASDMMWGDMRAAGVQVEEYRPVSLWRKHGLWLWRGSLLGRNHRKTLVVDSTTAFTGGMNLGDPWSRNATGEKAWRDTQICVSGPAAAHLDELFVDSWKYCTGETVPLLTPHREPNQQQDRGCKCLVVGSRGIGGRKTIRSLFSVHLERAQKSVNMTMPYFVPPKRLRASMHSASKRGVDVSVLVPRDSDVRIVDWLREGLYPQLLKWKVNVIEYLGPTLHAKTMVVDDEISIVGSNNFDILSVLLNREAALVVFDPETSEELSQQWQNDLALAHPVVSGWEGFRPWWRLLLARVGCWLLRSL